MFKRNKYNYKFRLNCVEAVLKEKHSVTWVAKQNGINRTNLRLWLGFYERYGQEGLLGRENRKYTPSFKREVLLTINKERLSLLSACVRFNIPSESIIINWRKSYELNGQAGLIAKSKGRPKKMQQPIKRKARKTTKPITREEELLIENEYLKAENELLKKLQALVQTNKKQKP
jgi:transposase